MDSGKDRGRRKFFKCFKPTSGDDHFGCESSEDESGRTAKKRLNRSFSGSVKAAFSKTSFVKKLRSKKCRHDSLRSSSASDSSSRSEKSVSFKLTEKKKKKKNTSDKAFSDSEEIPRTSSTQSSLFSSSPSIATSSSSSYSISSNSRSNSVDLSKQMSPITDRQRSLTRRESMKCVYSCLGSARGGMLSFIVCLVSLVLWGKVFAIMACTSMWLYFGPARQCSKLADSLVDSDEYRKKVVLRRLLERNRSQVR